MRGNANVRGLRRGGEEAKGCINLSKGAKDHDKGNATQDSRTSDAKETIGARRP